MLITDGYDMGPIPVFSYFHKQSQGTHYYIFFLWIKQARFSPRENKQFCNRTVCGALFRWLKAESSASLQEYPASPKEALRNPSSGYLEETERKLAHKHEIVTALNRFPQYGSETVIRDRDWQGIPSSTLLPSGVGGTVMFPKAGSYGDFKEDKTDPIFNL